MKKEDAEQYWLDMPEFENEKEEPPLIVAKFKFKTQDDFELFNSLLKEHVYKCSKVFDGMQRKESKQAWFPLKEKASKYEYK